MQPGSAPIFHVVRLRLPSFDPLQSRNHPSITVCGHLGRGIWRAASVSGANVQLYAVATAAGAASTPLLATPARTDASGAFTVGSGYTCPSPSSLIYLVATEGNPGLAPGTSNPSLSLLAAIGPCSSLGSPATVTLNEVGTVVAAWSLAPFMTTYSSVGSSAADAGDLANAFQQIRQTIDLAGNLQSTAAAGASDEVTPQINTIANILSSCVASKGGVAGDGSPCGVLFSEVTPAGARAPVETIGAALAIAANPTLNTAALYTLSTLTATFEPALDAPPAFWSVTPAASAGTTLPAGAIADYNFRQGSGSVLVDQTNSGNNGTLGAGALAPTWTSTGLHFAAQQNVALPASLNHAETFLYAVYIDPLAQSPPPSNQYPVLMSSSEGYSGFNFLYGAFLGAELVPDSYAPTLYAAGRPTTAARGALSGFHEPSSVQSPVKCFLQGFALSATVRQYIHMAYIQAADQGKYREGDLKILLAMPAKKEPGTQFGKRLFALRKARGLTQVQLAEALGTTQRVISYYETEAELPPASALIPLAQVLEVSTDELLGLEPARPAGREHPQQQRLWKRFQKMEALPTKDQRAVIRLINSLAGSSQSHAQTS